MARTKEKKIVDVVSVEDALKAFADLSLNNAKLMDRINRINKLVEEIVKQRIDLGISQRELAELTDIKQPMIARFEKSEMMPRIDTFIRIISALDMDIKLVHNHDWKFEKINIITEPLKYCDETEGVYGGIYYETTNKSELPCEA